MPLNGYRTEDGWRGTKGGPWVTVAEPFDSSHHSGRVSHGPRGELAQSDLRGRAFVGWTRPVAGPWMTSVAIYTCCAAASLGHPV